MISSFKDFQLSEEIIKALDEMQFQKPSEIQSQSIPPILERRDLIALAKTGSGKTAACAIPICQLVDTKTPHVQALIVVPTRELALQYAHETQKIGKFKGVKAFGLCGGEDYSLQQAKLKAGVQVLVATPGRLIDFIYARTIDLSYVDILILDEADEMLSMGFIDDLEFIIQCLIQKHQTLLFSATMPKEVKQIALKYLKEPVEVFPQIHNTIPAKIDHRFLFCEHHEREQKLFNLINDFNPKQGIVFCHSRIQAEKIAAFLQRHFRGVDLLHAGFSQDIRTIVTSKFRQQKIRLLVATDVVARGLDFSNVSHVFIFELSHDPDTYVHRSGRTGRFDKEGVVVTLVTRRELSTTDRIQKKLGHPLIWLAPPPPKTSSENPLPRRKKIPPRHGGGPHHKPLS